MKQGRGGRIAIAGVAIVSHQSPNMAALHGRRILTTQNHTLSDCAAETIRQIQAGNSLLTSQPTFKGC
ncbi:hypothetical protein VTH06DRAFT_8371 [Thermothelomyces fergusii]